MTGPSDARNPGVLGGVQRLGGHLSRGLLGSRGSTHRNSVVFSTEAVLTPQHQLYQPPPPADQYCKRRGRMTLRSDRPCPCAGPGSRPRWTRPVKLTWETPIHSPASRKRRRCLAVDRRPGRGADSRADCSLVTRLMDRSSPYACIALKHRLRVTDTVVSVTREIRVFLLDNRRVGGSATFDALTRGCDHED